MWLFRFASITISEIFTECALILAHKNVYKLFEKAETEWLSVDMVCLYPRQKNTCTYAIRHYAISFNITHRGSSFIEIKNTNKKKKFSGFFSRRREKERLRKGACNFHVEWMMISRDIHVNSGELCVSSIFFSVWFSSVWPYFVNDTSYVPNVCTVHVWLACVTKPFQWLEKSTNRIHNAIIIFFCFKIIAIYILYSSDVEYLNWMHIIEYA